MLPNVHNFWSTFRVRTEFFLDLRSQAVLVRATPALAHRLTVQCARWRHTKHGHDHQKDEFGMFINPKVHHRDALLRRHAFAYH